MNLNTLAYIGDEINKKKIRWAVGASVMLHFNDLVENPHDLDILVHEEDAKELDNLLSNIGVKKSNIYKDRKTFETKYFYKYVVKDMDIDLIGGFAIKHEEGKYNLTFDSSTVVSYKIIHGIKIPLSSLEDWYVLYQLIPGREHRVKTIEETLKIKGVNHPELLERAREKELPYSVRQRINEILGEGV